ncbi:MAG: TetR/AcrR family transcriptional regulator [Reyranella sp.]|jgi:TetR/AcrR family transcriptional regulator, transcriptional repressor for nem operon|nr:TetR/AcrR family transcriptional regulator [Reyranella sp.]
MRISEEAARANRERIVAKASELFRAHGFDGVAIGDVMKAAGFTHGGFYNHFASKDDLAADAVSQAFAQMAAVRALAPGLGKLLPLYLSETARKAPAKSCPAAALAGDVSRAAKSVRAAFADGLEEMVASVEAGLHSPRGANKKDRKRAINLVAKMVGGLALSRALPDSSPLADEILDAVLSGALDDVAGE